MTIYRNIKVENPEKSIVTVGMKFFIYEGILYPWKSTNGVGLELEEVGLLDKDVFNEYFTIDSEVPIEDIPFLVEQKWMLIEEIEKLTLDISDLENQLKKLIELK